MVEVWKDVPRWPGFQVTQTGRIKGPSGKILHPIAESKQNLQSLYTRLHVVTYDRHTKKRRTLYVHRAVLLAFVGPPKKGQEVRHLNGVADDNRLENLRWGNRLEQREDDRRNGVKHGKPQRLSQPEVDKIRLLYKHESAHQVAKKFGVSIPTIYAIWNNKYWT